MSLLRLRRRVPHRDLGFEVENGIDPLAVVVGAIEADVARAARVGADADEGADVIARWGLFLKLRRPGLLRLSRGDGPALLLDGGVGDEDPVVFLSGERTGPLAGAADHARLPRLDDLIEAGRHAAVLHAP